MSINPSIEFTEEEDDKHVITIRFSFSENETENKKIKESCARLLRLYNTETFQELGVNSEMSIFVSNTGSRFQLGGDVTKQELTKPYLFFSKTMGVLPIHGFKNTGQPSYFSMLSSKKQNLFDFLKGMFKTKSATATPVVATSPVVVREELVVSREKPDKELMDEPILEEPLKEHAEPEQPDKEPINEPILEEPPKEHTESVEKNITKMEETDIIIKIYLYGFIQKVKYTYNDLFQERKWIEKAAYMNLRFDSYTLYKVNGKIILVGILKEEFVEGEIPKTSLGNHDINDIFLTEWERFNERYPGIDQKIKGTELYYKLHRYLEKGPTI
jgi:hypothetical protein